MRFLPNVIKYRKSQKNVKYEMLLQYMYIFSPMLQLLHNMINTFKVSIYTATYTSTQVNQYSYHSTKNIHYYTHYTNTICHYYSSLADLHLVTHFHFGSLGEKKQMHQYWAIIVDIMASDCSQILLIHPKTATGQN